MNANKGVAQVEDLREILRVDDLPSTIQQILCGELEWDIHFDKPAVGGGAAASSTVDAKEQDQAKQKRHKSQRRMEKEQEYHERQQRMQENQKAKADAMKRTKCKFFQLGKCKEGAGCRFSHSS